MGIGKQTLSEKTATAIVAMITVDKSFPPGSKLPNEPELAARLNVSRTTLREAVRTLVSRRILEIRRGQGTFVVKHSDLEHPLNLNVLSRAHIDIGDLYEIRLIFEPQVAAYAARRATAEDIERILHFGTEEERLIQSGENRTAAEHAFHQAIAMAAHNAFIEQLMPVIYQAIDKGVELSVRNEAVIGETVSDHRMIMDFIRDHNVPGAETAMRLHVIHAMSVMKVT